MILWNSLFFGVRVELKSKSKFIIMLRIAIFTLLQTLSGVISLLSPQRVFAKCDNFSNLSKVFNSSAHQPDKKITVITWFYGMNDKTFCWNHFIYKLFYWYYFRAYGWCCLGYNELSWFFVKESPFLQVQAGLTLLPLDVDYNVSVFTAS